MAKRIGVFFGDFDPVYGEVVRMCEDITHEFGLDRVLLAPFWMPRRRAQYAAAYFTHRTNMIKLATRGNPKVSLLDEYVVKDNAFKYQADILNKLSAKHNAEVCCIMTSNHFLTLPKKQDYGYLVRDRNIILALRPHYTEHVPSLISTLASRHNAHITVSATRNCTLSSSVVRLYIQMGALDETYMPASVLDYINKNILYKTHSALFERVRELLPEPIYRHTIATCLNCVELASLMNVNQTSARLAGLLHNIGKCCTAESLEKDGVYVPDSYRKTNTFSMHGYLSELAARYFMTVTDEEILDAVKYHSTGYADMPPLTALLFAAALLAGKRTSPDYDSIRYDFFESPSSAFLRLLEEKYRRIRCEAALFDFPADLHACYTHYKRKKNLERFFSPVRDTDNQA